MRRFEQMKRVVAMLCAVCLIVTMAPMPVAATEVSEDVVVQDTVAEGIDTTVEEVQENETQETTSDAAQKEVSVSIYDYTAVEANVAGASENGVILENAKVSVDENAGIAEAIKKAADEAGISCTMEPSSYGGYYITEINGLGAAVEGYADSGWMYCVNQDYNRYMISDGDAICMSYSLNRGADINNGYDEKWNPVGPVFTKIVLNKTEIDLSALQGTGSKEDPYVIPVDTKILPESGAITAEYSATENQHYIAFGTEEGYVDLSQPQDYHNVIACCLAGIVGTQKTYYRFEPQKVLTDSEKLTLLDRYLDNNKVWPQLIRDQKLEEAQDQMEVKITSSDEACIKVEGTELKVVRPAVGSSDALVEIKVSVSCQGVEKSREYQVTVPAIQDTATDEGMIREANALTREYFLKNRELKSYWDVWAAYSALGDYIQDRANGYAFPELTKGGTGAEILQVVAQGENPYNYQGKDLIADLIQKGLDGSFSVPIYNILALDAAGSNCEERPMEKAIANMKSLTWGPDMGGWAAVVAARHMKEEAHSEVIADAMKYFLDSTQKDITAGTYPNGVGLSMGCVAMGVSALHVAGVENCDMAKDSCWTQQKVIPTMYGQYVKDGEISTKSFNIQYALDFCDLYRALYGNSNVSWVSCGVNGEKLEALRAQAREILADPMSNNSYSKEQLGMIHGAYKAVEDIEVSKDPWEVADYGREYYTLKDAIAKKAAGVKEFEQLVAQIPERLALEDRAFVEEVRAIYEAMSAEQKAQISQDVYARLKEAEEQIKVLARLGLALSGENAVDYELNVEKTKESTKAYQAFKKAVITGKLEAAYDITVFDEQAVQKDVKLLARGTRLNIPVKGKYEKYVIAFYKDKKVSYLPTTVKADVASAEITTVGTYAVIGYNKVAAPTIKVKDVQYQSVKISWNKKPGAKNYTVYRATSKNGTYKKIITVKTNTYRDQKLATNKTYYYSVRAEGSLYGVNYRTGSSNKIKARTELKTPVIKTKAATKKVTIEISKVSGAQGYVIYRATSKKGTYKKLATVKGTSYTDKGLTSKKSYYYKVRAYRSQKGKNVYSAFCDVVRTVTK